MIDEIIAIYAITDDLLVYCDAGYTDYRGRTYCLSFPAYFSHFSLDLHNPQLELLFDANEKT